MLHIHPALHHAKTDQERAAVLRQIKNYIIGHELRKKEYVQAGLISSIAQFLRKSAQSPQDDQRADNQLWLQTAAVTCVLARGGPAYVSPILSSSIVTSLLGRFVSETSDKSSLALLRALNAIADNLPLASPDSWSPDKRLANAVYCVPFAENLARTIARANSSHTSQQACEAALALICKTCTEDRQRQVLVRTGVLSALCKRLSHFITTEMLKAPLAPGLGPDSQPTATAPTPRSVSLSPVLETICVIVATSRRLANYVLADESILATLPDTTSDFSPTDIHKAPWGSPYLSGNAVPKGQSQTILDALLPHLPDYNQFDQEHTSFPPLSSTALFPKRRSSSIRATLEKPRLPTSDTQSNDGEESPLVPWLLYLVRTYRGRRRLVATQLLVLFHQHRLVKQSRIRTFGALLVPILVRMLHDPVQADSNSCILAAGTMYPRVAPAVLADLIEDSENMQEVAVESKAIPKLIACLKGTFEATAVEKINLWRPKQDGASQTAASNSPERSLGIGGPTTAARHLMAFREGLLRALAAIAPFNDHYRKEICDEGALPQIMLSLEPFVSEKSLNKGQETELATSGNSTSALLAACNAVRALTRSVTALRTKLVDAEVGKAIVKLMDSSDPEVRIAATKVLSNLAMDFSPVKQSLSEPRIIKKLAEQAHSASARLRFESIWALKQLVLNASDKLKREVIDELGPNWIRHLLATDPYDIPPGEVIGLDQRDYPPRQVQSDVIMSDVSDEDDDDHNDDDDDDDDDDKNSTSDRPATEDSERNFNFDKHTVKDDISIQEQLLDLVRNLFCGEKASDTLEYLFNEIGTDTFVQILIDRMRPRSVHGGSRYRRGMENSAATATHKVVVKVLYIVVHIAASAPKWRDMLSSNTQLMQHLVPFFSHADEEIRQQCCWIVINLTYEDESADREGARQRAMQMCRLGFMPPLKRLENDAVPNVRERAKTATHLLEKAAG